MCSSDLPSEVEVFEAVLRWKQKRRPPLDETDVASTIRNLGMLRWLDVKPDAALRVPDDEENALIEDLPPVPQCSTEHVQVGDLLAWRAECINSQREVSSRRLEHNVAEMALLHALIRRRSAYTMFIDLYGSLSSDVFLARTDPLVRSGKSQCPSRGKGKARAVDLIDVDSDGEGGTAESEEEDGVARALDGDYVGEGGAGSSSK